MTPLFRFGIVALALVLVAGSGGYWLGKRAGRDGPAASAVAEVQLQTPAPAAAAARPAVAPDSCARPGPGPVQLLLCMRDSVRNGNIPALIEVLGPALASVEAGRVPLASLADVLAEANHLPLDFLFHYIEAEIDPRKIELASQLLQQLLQRRTSAQMGATDIEWLIDNVNRLLWLTPNQIRLNLWLANLYLQQGQFDEARYHALIAVDAPEYREAAGKILQKLALGSKPSSDVDLQVVGNQYFIAARIDGAPARLLLDTGASISGVTRAFIEHHGIDTGPTEVVQLNTAGGVREARSFQVKRLAFGQLVFAEQPMVIFMDAQFETFDGVLGLDVLRQADFYIDEKAAKLRIF
ncbi:MAG: clan AA aspartic protease [Gammaproteobacteria bacterium]|uniref:retropepsin-like aspartic protease family protein n=1 Tax=Pseudomaricurvus alcaniphilus TaxID=1166482 RepID=UPI00140962F1|nr:retropepsin-like aspartic protease [Pseudomaricurvus alcaniphilus]MBR9910342.1 clan AA aspartic protease [Gammaproteobacteria bacterium]NHN36247.1 clan AA aspartic protease [Pseudomaricurvus alcaniphilus]